MVRWFKPANHWVKIMLTKNLNLTELSELSNKKLKFLIDELDGERIQCEEKLLQYDRQVDSLDRQISEAEKEIIKINNLIKETEYLEYEIECDLKIAQAEFYFREVNSICKYTPEELEEAGQMVLFEGSQSN